MKTEAVILHRDYDHDDETGSRTFRAGVHTLPAEIAAAARAKGAVDEVASPPRHAAANRVRAPKPAAAPAKASPAKSRGKGGRFAKRK